jgi:hypothetical protein
MPAVLAMQNGSIQDLNLMVWTLTSRDENGRKWSVNTKTITVFIFLSETKSKTVALETETISVFRKYRKRKFGAENTPVTVEF